LDNFGGLKDCSAQILEHGGDPSQHLNMENFLALMEALGDADEEQMMVLLRSKWIHSQIM